MAADTDVAAIDLATVFAKEPTAEASAGTRQAGDVELVLRADGVGSRLQAPITGATRFRRDDLGDARCAFLRSAPEAAALELTLSGAFCLEQCAAGGWLALPADGGAFAFWSPQPARWREIGPQGHVLSEGDCAPAALSLDRRALRAGFRAPPGRVLDLALWKLPLDLAQELRRLSPLETQGYFLWGSHTAYRQPADVYLHLIFGHVYENRYAWPFKRRICSENDAHALSVALAGLRLATGKRIYDLLYRQVLLGVLARQGEDGGFRHGEWTQEMEAHFRLHCSAMHLMMDSLAICPGDATRAALAQAARFLMRAADRLDCGTWFVHDELELSPEAMDRGPFSWVPSRTLGKSPANMLVLNTHVDATVALDRYAEMTGDDQYAAAVRGARDATRTVLAMRPAEWLYRIVFAPVALTLLPRAEQAKLPLSKRIAKRVGWQFLIPNLHRLKARWPRLVMPGGYIDRAVPLAAWSFHYLSVNLMDLVRQQRRLPDPQVREAIDGALRFTHDSGVLARWAELDYEKYAIGFWADLLLEQLGMGLPPSVLGANAEAIEPGRQRPCPAPPAPAVRVINLADSVLLVNCGATSVTVAPATTPGVDCGGELELAPRAWVRRPFDSEPVTGRIAKAQAE